LIPVRVLHGAAPKRGNGGANMPKAWSDKRERQYEHVKESEEERGRPEKTAKRIAAATVNKTRSEKGETKSKR
jgi:hypothetical protein